MKTTLTRSADRVTFHNMIDFVAMTNSRGEYVEMTQDAAEQAIRSLMTDGWKVRAN